MRPKWNEMRQRTFATIEKELFFFTQPPSSVSIMFHNEMKQAHFCACGRLIVRGQVCLRDQLVFRTHSLFTVSLEIRHCPILVVFERGERLSPTHTQKKTNPKQKQKSSTNNDLFLYVSITVCFFSSSNSFNVANLKIQFNLLIILDAGVLNTIWGKLEATAAAAAIAKH